MKKFLLVLATGLLVACDVTPSADEKAARKTEVAMQQASSEVGMPAIHNFNEMRLVKQIYELRDDAKLETWTYTTDMSGRRHLLCKSIGYGVPYGVQFSNPMRVTHEGANYGMTMPQAEPNGLFMPDQAEATWIVCVAPKGEPKPLYVEDRVIVSPFALNEWEDAGNGKL